MNKLTLKHIINKYCLNTTIIILVKLIYKILFIEIFLFDNSI